LAIEGEHRHLVCIYHFSDSAGHADEYVFFFLKEMRRVADKIILVAKVKPAIANEARLSEIVDVIITVGDVTRQEAFKIGLSKLCLNDTMQSEQDIVYANDDVFGPFYPMERVMQEGLLPEIEEVMDGCNNAGSSYLDRFKTDKCPFLNIDFFADPSYSSRIRNTIGHEAVEIFKMLRQDGFYPTDMIIKHLLRTRNLKDIRDTMHFNHIFPSVSLPNNNSVTKYMNVALIMHIHYPECIKECLAYAMSMPHTSDLFITTDSPETASLIEKESAILKCRKFEILQVVNRGRDVSALLVGSREFVFEYDLICFAHDKKSSQITPYTVGRDFAYKCFESVLSTSGYVDNIIAKFKEEPLLGILQPHPPYHGRYYIHYGDEWTMNYEFTTQLANRFGINVNIRRDKAPPAPFGTMFWFRPVALEKAFRIPLRYEDFPPEPHDEDGTFLHAIERLYPYIAQDAGYYAAYVAPDHLASIEEDNIAYLLQTLKNDLMITMHGPLPIPQENKSILCAISPPKAIGKKLKKIVQDHKRKRTNLEWCK
jgi:lipopolysaccharide biosynthesis protein